MRLFASVTAVAALLSAASGANAASATNTEEKFQDLFVTAGYCTGYGAAIGAAFLAFQDRPTDNLKFVAMGASLGFLGGSVLGSYIVFSPGFTENRTGDGSTLLAGGAMPDRGVVVRPTIDVKRGALTGVEGGMTLIRW
jgi:hypothetical protein